MAGKKPVKEIRLHGIRAAIWSNCDVEGQYWFNVAITRTFKDGEHWKEATSFRRDDLPIVAKVADLAFTWIWNEQGIIAPEPEPEMPARANHEMQRKVINDREVA